MTPRNTEYAKYDPPGVQVSDDALAQKYLLYTLPSWLKRKILVSTGVFLQDWFAAKAEEYWLLEDRLQQFELRNAQPPALLTNNTATVVKGTRGAGKVPCSGDANKNKMVVVL